MFSNYPVDIEVSLIRKILKNFHISNNQYPTDAILEFVRLNTQYQLNIRQFINTFVKALLSVKDPGKYNIVNDIRTQWKELNNKINSSTSQDFIKVITGEATLTLRKNYIKPVRTNNPAQTTIML